MYSVKKSIILIINRLILNKRRINMKLDKKQNSIYNELKVKFTRK